MLLIKTQVKQGEHQGYAVFRGNGFDIPLTTMKGTFFTADVMSQCENLLSNDCDNGAFVHLSKTIQGCVPYNALSEDQKRGFLKAVYYALGYNFCEENYELVRSFTERLCLVDRPVFDLRAHLALDQNTLHLKDMDSLSKAGEYKVVLDHMAFKLKLSSNDILKATLQNINSELDGEGGLDFKALVTIKSRSQFMTLEEGQ